MDVTSNGNRLSAGYVVGGGAELDPGRQLSAKLEYRYLNFGTTTLPHSVNLDPGTPTAATLSGPSLSHDHQQIVSAGCNYRFQPGRGGSRARPAQVDGSRRATLPLPRTGWVGPLVGVGQGA